ncbi:MAG: hypothetical protein JST79_01755 [Acidobacteria bacterium]|jgi:hypothetical protein|nr:hypothetical protein [Acidobacteriota bacterium]
MAITLGPPWNAFLGQLDSLLLRPVTIHCLGGFVVTAYYGIEMPTSDLDYLLVRPADAYHEIEALAGLGSALSKKHRVYIQNVGVGDYPEDYEERLTKMDVGLKNLTLLALDPYDLLLSKITRNGQKDREHVRLLAQHLSLKFSILQQRFDVEMKPWLPNLARHELTLQLWKEYFAE